MDTLPKVSIITVFHNRETTAKESVQSLLNQTYKNLDIYIVDDKSTDNTVSIIEEVCNNDPRVKIIQNKPNKGFTKSLIDVISGLDCKYVAIHGSGDISLPTRIEKQVEFLEAHPEAGVVTVGVANRAHDNFSDTVKEITLKDLLGKNRINHGAVLYKLDEHRKAGGYRSFFIQRQDKDLWYRMSLITKLYFIPDRLYAWTKQEVSISTETGKSLIPSLISEFATFLIKERIRDGYDSLDKYGERAGLMFNPATSNHIFLKDFQINLVRGRFGLSLKHINALIAINTSIFTLAYLYVLKGMLKFLMLFHK
ncbi:glycosyltransferase family 2 protein [Mucilaginibacter sp. cycad4]|uniref:glycosyltransferase family 2 protein n=1 Tax=Mucilaginibacter sp. cycad4 TaxID=3342096 RepID=UPI002AAB3942|nr:glycosyltransferase family 2 protein [Mucilaginibacter gossypii]WPV00223.1 glycosyltransferase family 2 protein [Mucilaginibacter gossypii]